MNAKRSQSRSGNLQLMWPRKLRGLTRESTGHGVTDRQLGQAIESDLLPGWNVAHARFASITLGDQAPAAEKLRSLTELVRVRRDMFSEYSAGLQTGDTVRIKRAEALSVEAQQLVKAIREKAGKQ